MSSSLFPEFHIVVHLYMCSFSPFLFLLSTSYRMFLIFSFVWDNISQLAVLPESVPWFDLCNLNALLNWKPLGIKIIVFWFGHYVVLLLRECLLRASLTFFQLLFCNILVIFVSASFHIVLVLRLSFAYCGLHLQTKTNSCPKNILVWG